MAILFFILACAVLFTWLLVRSARAGYGKFVFWLVWFVAGLCVVLSIPQPAPAIARALVQAWSYSLLALPVWWAISAGLRRNGRS